MKPLLLLLAGCAACSPLAVQAESLSYEQAWQQLQSRSDSLAAARAGLESKRLQREGLEGLGGPVVSFNSSAYAYNANLNLDLGHINQQLGQLAQGLSGALSALRIPSTALQLPSSYAFQRHATGTTASVSALWPLYMGGLGDATRGLIGAQAQEAQADADKTQQDVATQLVQRYFGAQLALRAAWLRQQAQRTLEQHDQAAGRMMAAGVISRVERLQASVALEDARRQALKAQDDAELAATALARTVRAQGQVSPSTALFVLTQPLEPLSHFQEAALRLHPGLNKVAAKKAQAERLHQGEEALRKPQVFAFGSRELRSGNADWVAGVGLRWTLYDAVDRNTLAAASLKQIEQAEHSDAQARSDIALLVEQNWRAVEQARRHFVASQPSLELGREVLRLRQAGLQQGTSTTLDLMDAQTRLTQAETEQAQAANDYVQALARLLHSCGLGQDFNRYLARADVKVPTP